MCLLAFCQNQNTDFVNDDVSTSNLRSLSGLTSGFQHQWDELLLTNVRNTNFYTFMWGWYGLMSNYFDLLFAVQTPSHTVVQVSAHCQVSASVTNIDSRHTATRDIAVSTWPTSFPTCQKPSTQTFCMQPGLTSYFLLLIASSAARATVFRLLR